MRSAVLAVLVGLCGCNQVFGIGDPPAACAAGCACTTDKECGFNQFCDDHGTSTTCECAAGYGLTAAGCTWQGIVTDPGFTQVSSWTAANSAVVDVSAVAVGLKDVGVARLGNGPCSATLSQQVVVPRSAMTAALVAEITYATAGAVAPMFGIGAVWSTVPASQPAGAWTTARICLGGGQYASETSTGPGQPLTLAVGRTVDGACLAGGPAVDVDRFEIVPAHVGECPVPGQVLNGLADAYAGWTFVPSTGSAALSAGLVAGVGQNGSPGAKLVAASSCGPAAAVVALSPGLAGTAGSPALSFYVSAMPAVATGPTGLTAALDRSQIAMPAVQTTTTTRVCVPAPQRGAGGSLGITMSSAVCTFSGTAIIDTVELEPDPRCGSHPALADPGFESGYPLLDTAVPDPTGAIHSVPAADAHDGARVLEMAVGTCTAPVTFRLHVQTPSAAQAASPALTYWVRSANPLNSQLSVVSGQGPTGAALTATWQQASVCLDPALAGRGQDVSFALGCVNPGSPPAVVQIDDLDVIAGAACPSK